MNTVYSSKQKPIDGKTLSLSDWLEIALSEDQPRRMLDCQFATDEHLEEYLSSIKTRSDKEIKKLLSRFLISCGHIAHDRGIRYAVLALDEDARNEQTEKHSFLKRVIDFSKDSHPWQGITWVIDLLPDNPKEAINALNAYFQAHCIFMTDERMQGLSDSVILITKKYLEHDLPVKETLLNLAPRDFELLVAHLYRLKGYTIKVTKKTRDGGYDIIAETDSVRGVERLHIECKRYEENVGVSVIRSTLGTLLVSIASKGIIVTSSNFTPAAKAEARLSKRLELMSLDEFDKDMRKYAHARWTIYTQRYVMEMKKFIGE